MVNQEQINNLKKGDKLFVSKSGSFHSALKNKVLTFSNWVDKDGIDKNTFWQCEELFEKGFKTHNIFIGDTTMYVEHIHGKIFSEIKHLSKKEEDLNLEIKDLEAQIRIKEGMVINIRESLSMYELKLTFQDVYCYAEGLDPNPWVAYYKITKVVNTDLVLADKVYVEVDGVIAFHKDCAVNILDIEKYKKITLEEFEDRVSSLKQMSINIFSGLTEKEKPSVKPPVKKEIQEQTDLFSFDTSKPRKGPAPEKAIKHQYWNKTHDELLKNGWTRIKWGVTLRDFTRSESKAIREAKVRRWSGCLARVLSVKTNTPKRAYAVIYRSRKNF